MKAVLFDLDRTLLDRDSAIAEYAERLWERWKTPNDPGRVEFVSRFVELDARGRGDKQAMFRSLVSEVLSGGDAEVLHQEFEGGFPASVHPFADALPVLQALRKEGLLLGVVSNGRGKLQRAKLAGSQLVGLLDVIIISEEIGFRKPAPEIFHAALEALHCRAEEVVLVGDSEQTDIQGAKAAGMFPVLRRYAGETFPTEAHREVWSLSDLLALPGLVSEKPSPSEERFAGREANIFRGFRR